MPPSERAEIDRRRTLAHNVLIDALNILSRSMERRGEDISWRAMLGNDRVLIGDIACHLHCALGIRAG
jgi:hypothetical protein